MKVKYSPTYSRNYVGNTYFGKFELLGLAVAFGLVIATIVAAVLS